MLIYIFNNISKSVFRLKKKNLLLWGFPAQLLCTFLIIPLGNYGMFHIYCLISLSLLCDRWTLVHALRLCTGRTAHRRSRGIALLFVEHCTRRGWGISVTPRPLFPLGKDPVPILQEAGWALGSVWMGAESLAPTGIRSPDRQACSQSLYRPRYPAIMWQVWIYIFMLLYILFRYLFTFSLWTIGLFMEYAPNVYILGAY